MGRLLQCSATVAACGAPWTLFQCHRHPKRVFLLCTCSRHFLRHTFETHVSVCSCRDGEFLSLGSDRHDSEVSATPNALATVSDDLSLRVWSIDGASPSESGDAAAPAAAALQAEQLALLRGHRGRAVWKVCAVGGGSAVVTGAFQFVSTEPSCLHAETQKYPWILTTLKITVSAGGADAGVKLWDLSHLASAAAAASEPGAQPRRPGHARRPGAPPPQPPGAALCERLEFPLPPVPGSDAVPEGGQGGDSGAGSAAGEFPCGGPDSLPLYWPPTAEPAEPQQQQAAPPKPKPPKQSKQPKQPQNPKSDRGKGKQEGREAGGDAAAAGGPSTGEAAAGTVAPPAPTASTEEEPRGDGGADGDEGGDGAGGAAGGGVRDSTTEYIRMVTFASADVLLAATNRGLIQALSLRASSQAPAAPAAAAPAPREGGSHAGGGGPAGSWFLLFANPAPCPWMALATSPPIGAARAHTQREASSDALRASGWSALALAGDMAGWAVLLRVDVSASDGAH